MGITLQNPPGFSDLADALLVQDYPALGIRLGAISDNAEFGLVRTEVFFGTYINGDTVPLPVSPIDGYAYSREELIYPWTIRNSGNPTTGWVGGADSLFYCAWLVDQTTGQVYSDEWYRRSGRHADVSHTNDGRLFVWTIAQRQKTHLIMAASPAYSAIAGSSFAQDKPLTQAVAQALSRNAKVAVVNHEVFYLGEYTNGQTVTLPTSPVDGYVYSAGECKFRSSWRWTAPAATPLAAPALANGQMGPLLASVNGSGVVSITVKYIDDAGALNTTHDGRIAVFAFTQRSGTPGSISPAATSFAEVALEDFLPGSPLPFATVKQIDDNTTEALLTPEYFGPTNYADGSTVAIPTSPIDGYVYSRSELDYVWSWADTTNQTGSNLRNPIFLAHIDQTTGVVTINVWRLPPGGPYVDDNNTIARLSVIVVARRGRQLQAVIGTPSVSPQTDYSTGGNQVVDVPTLSGQGYDHFTGNSSTTAFTLSNLNPIVGAIVWWNGVFQKPSKYSISGSTLTTAFTDANGNSQPADTNDDIDVVWFF